MTGSDGGGERTAQETAAVSVALVRWKEGDRALGQDRHPWGRLKKGRDGKHKLQRYPESAVLCLSTRGRHWKGQLVTVEMG